MIADGRHLRSIRSDDSRTAAVIIDQTVLPFELRTATLRTLDDAAGAIADMRVRGAPLIGATAAYGIALAARHDPSDRALEAAATRLAATRPTAVNLRWALARTLAATLGVPAVERATRAFAEAEAICEEDVRINQRIGEHGLNLLRDIATRNGGRPVEILTHCNAGWLATVDWGTATAPIYAAARAGIPVHIWVDETRPRLQGSLTAWELAHEGIPHTVITDNAGGHLMQQGRVDIVITGTDRVTRHGDVANKVGTYLKALAAHDNGVPFHVAAPSPSIDWSIDDAADIPIEERADEEVTHVRGLDADGAHAAVRVLPASTPVLNIGFDITPARLVTGLITERGIVRADHHALAALFEEHQPA